MDWYMLMIAFLGLYNCFDCYEKHLIEEKYSDLKKRVDALEENKLSF